MSSRILVSGFERFGEGMPPNISSEVVLPALQQSRGDVIDTITLPVEHDTAAELLIERIDATHPKAVIMFGISFPNDPVRLERFAHNRGTNAVPDNEGVRRGGRILEDGHRRVESTLPLSAIKGELKSKGVRNRVSLGAGNFICNEVFYLTGLHNLELNTPTGFVHLGSDLDKVTARTAAEVIVDAVYEF